jgi:type I restriction enzyme S subunit
VRKGMLDFSDRQYVQPPGGAEGERTGARIGDILIIITGNSVGNVAYLKQGLGSAYVSQHVGLVRLGEPKLADYICRYLSPCAPGNPQIEISQSGQSKPGLNLQNLKDFRLAIPTLPGERDAITKALSDIDSAIEQLCKLIAKKRSIKQAVMQELLTGKRRLPGFKGEWAVKRLGDVAHIKTGGRNNEDKIEDGEYPFFVRSDNVERINSYSYDCEAILVPGEGRIGDIFHYVNGRFDVHQRVYAITQFKPGLSGKFLHSYMAMNFGTWAMQNTVKATVDSLR